MKTKTDITKIVISLAIIIILGYTVGLKMAGVKMPHFVLATESKIVD